MTSECTSDGSLSLSDEERVDIVKNLQQQIKQAKSSAIFMANLAESEKSLALELIERELRESVNYIVEANKKDLENPDNADLSSALKDRLTLNLDRIMAMANGVRKIAGLEDPVNRVIDGWQHPNGMKINRVTVPLGVVGIIYEARPNVTTDAIALAIKSGNSVVLRGSRQAWHTNLAIMDVVNRALRQSAVPAEGIQYLKDQSREGCMVLLRARQEIDLVIPRGGEGLNRFVAENSLIPVMGAGGGTCHTYIDQYADIDKAVEIAINAKTQRPSVCNSCESIIIHREILDEIIEPLFAAMERKDVEVVADEVIANKVNGVTLATESDWGSEYLDLKLTMKVVEDIQEAVEHINKYSTQHSEAIVTEDLQSADVFKRMVNSACVYVNASTRFTDGEEFGFGAEMGISTSKMHARGPIGAKELCTYKYIIEGSGQIR